MCLLGFGVVQWFFDVLFLLIAYAHSARPYCRVIGVVVVRGFSRCCSSVGVVVVVVVIVVVVVVVVAVWRCCCRDLFSRLIERASCILRCSWSPLGVSLSGSLGSQVSLLRSIFSWVGLRWFLGVPGGFLGILGWRAEAEGGLGKMINGNGILLDLQYDFCSYVSYTQRNNDGPRRMK